VVYCRVLYCSAVLQSVVLQSVDQQSHTLIEHKNFKTKCYSKYFNVLKINYVPTLRCNAKLGVWLDATDKIRVQNFGGKTHWKIQIVLGL
jgi:hypothetical protein